MIQSIEDVDGLGSIHIGDAIITGKGAQLVGNGHTWVDSAGVRYQFDAVGAGGQVGKMLLSGGVLGEGKIAIDDFDLGKAMSEKDGYLGIKLAERIGMAANSGASMFDSAAAPAAASLTASGNIQAFRIALAGISDEDRTVRVSGAGGSFSDIYLNIGDGMLDMSGGPVNVVIPAGRDSVEVGLVYGGPANQGRTLSLISSLVQPDRPDDATVSNALTVSFTNTGAPKDATATLDDFAYLTGPGDHSKYGAPGTPAYMRYDSELKYSTFRENKRVDSTAANVAVIAGEGDNFVTTNGGHGIVLADDGKNRIYVNKEVSIKQAIIDANTGSPTGLKGMMIATGQGNNTIVGGNGDDLISVGGGNNVVVLGPGKNLFIGGMIPDRKLSPPNLNWDPHLTANGGFRITGAEYWQSPSPEGKDVNLATYDGNWFNYIGYGVGGTDYKFPLGFGSTTIFGGRGDSAIYLPNGTNYVDAGTGNSTVFGGMNNDTIFGGTGNVRLTGAGGDDYITLESGNDWASGNSGNNTLIGGDGNSIIFAGGNGGDWATKEKGSNLVQAGDGATLVYGSGGKDTLIGGAGRTTLLGGAGEEYIVAGTGNTSIMGGAGHNTLVGGSGNDTIFAGTGDTTIRGGAGQDFLSGGDGATLIYVGDGGTVAAKTAARAGKGATTIHGGTGNCLIFGGEGANVLYAGSGGGGTSDADFTQVLAGSGNTTIYGGAGVNHLIGGDGNDLIFGGSGGTSAMPTDLSGGRGNDTLVAGSGFNRLFGGSGPTTFVAGKDAGSFMIFNSDSADTLRFDDSVKPEELSISNVPGGVEISTARGSIKIDGGLQRIAFPGGETTLDAMRSQGFSLGAATYSALDVTLPTVPVVAGAPLQTVTLTGAADLKASGNNVASVIRANSGKDTLIGGSANDTLIGGSGANEFVAGSGNTTMVAGSGAARFVVNAGSGNVTIRQSRRDDILQFGAGLNAADVKVSSSAGAGGVAIVTFKVAGGATVVVEGDAVTGILGHIAFSDGATSTVSGALLQADPGAVTVSSAAGMALPAGAVALTLTGSASVLASGNQLDNILRANPGRDTLVAGAGSDTLVGAGAGSGGVATYVPSADGVTTIAASVAGETIAFGAGVRAAQLSAGLVLGADGSKTVNIFSDSGAVVVVQGDHAGNMLDKLSFDDGSTIGLNALVQQSNAHGHMMYSALSLALPAGIAQVQLTGSANLSASGSGANEFILANDGNDTLSGGGGNDTLVAGMGNSVLIAGSGVNTLVAGIGNTTMTGNGKTAGAGVTTYEYEAGDGLTTIVDGAAGDILALVGGIAANVVKVIRAGADLQIMVNGEKAVMVKDYYLTPTPTLGKIVFADGSFLDQPAIAVQVEIADGTMGRDVLYGTSGADVIHGFDGNDWINGMDGNDHLYGENGSDYLVGDSGDDTLDGGAGMDSLAGGWGKNVYLFGRGDGQDHIVGNPISYGMDNVAAASSPDLLNTIQFKPGILPSDVTFRRAPNRIGSELDELRDPFHALELTIRGTDDTITYENIFFGDEDGFSYHAAQVRFDDGTVWSPAFLQASVLLPSDGDDHIIGTRQADYLTGGKGNDTLRGAGGADTLEGGAGDDLLIDWGARDVFVFGRGDGHDRLGSSSSNDNNPQGVLRFKAGIAASDVVISRNRSDLLISIAGGTDSVTVSGYFQGEEALTGYASLNQIEFADGTIWGADAIRPFLMTGTSNNDQLGGYDTDDLIDGAEGNDILYGALGNDTLRGGAGNDTLRGGRGENVLDGGAGDDRYETDVFGNDIYLFGRGSGHDTIVLARLSEKPKVMRLAADIAVADVALIDMGKELIVTLPGTDDTLMVEKFFNGGTSENVSLEFADGTTLSATDLFLKAEQRTNAAPQINGSFGWLRANQGSLFSYTIADGMYTDVDSWQRLTYSAKMPDGSPLPAWLSFNPAERTLSGTPDAAALGQLSFVVYASDGASATGKYVTMNIEPPKPNEAPTLSSELGDQIAQAGVSFSYTVEAGAFADPDSGNKLTYSARLQDGSALPAWLHFDATTRTFSGVPANLAKFSVTVTATDAGGLSASDVFDLAVQAKAFDLTGTAGKDVLTGAAGNDKLHGMAGNDTLSGGEGNDLLDGGEGADRMEGGAGDDRYIVDAAGDQAIEGAVPGYDTVETKVSYTLGANLEVLVLTGSANIDGTGNESSNDLTGNDGNNRLDGGAGGDRMEGRDGDDTYLVDSVDDRVTEYADFGIDTIIRSVNVNTTLPYYVENLILTGTAATGRGNDIHNVISGNASANKLYGMGGDDVVDGKGGNDTLDGGAGNDTYLFARGDGQDSIDNLDVKAASDGVQFGAGIADTDVMALRSGNNLALKIRGSTDQIGVTDYFAADVVTNGQPSDKKIKWVKFAGGTVWNQATIQANVDASASNHAPVLGTAVPALQAKVGSVFTYAVPANTMTDADLGDSVTYSAKMANGAALPAWLAFDALSRTLSGTPGSADIGTGTLQFVLTGADRYGAAANLTVTMKISLPNRVPVLAAPVPDKTAAQGAVFSYALAAGAFTDPDAGDTLSYTATLANGAALPAWLSFNPATLTFSGTPTSAGTLSIKLSAKDTGGLSASDVFDLAVSIQNLLVNGSANADTLAAGDGNDTLNGLAGNDTLSGLGGDDTLDGGVGVDRLIGGVGNDVFVVDGTTDVIVENANEGNDLVKASATYTLSANVENLTLLSTALIDGTGNAGDNVLTGNAAVNTLYGLGGNDMLDGAAGADKLYGGAGNDVYFVDNAADVVTENAAEGVDLVQSSVAYTLPANLEALRLTALSNVNATGNSVDNLIIGNVGINVLNGLGGNDILQGGDGVDTVTDTAGNNLLDGGNGADILTGGIGNEMLIGGAGNDTITSSTGADVIAFNRGDGQDIVNASTGKDNTLSLGKGILYADLLFKKSANDLILVTGASEQINLKDWYLGTTNRSVANLQMVIEGTSDYNAAPTNKLNNKKIEQFNFDGLATAFDQARIANPALTSWAVSSSLLNFYLSGSDTAAIGGDLAYQYAKNGTLSNVSLTPAAAILVNASFGTAAQTLQAGSTLQDLSPRLM
ncbi:putative Ig domain-containing protein [Massilia antarctica]|uniref:putative Ig domain-containing protein n=1 Tax=Massilia antarctica TaxID=2765360 RepID=UPI0027D951CC|nr:putative Ig domain-containing protein [Massilia sp. H27-R4]